MLLISTESAARRLESSENLANRLVRNNSHLEIKPINHGGGRAEGIKNLTENERAIIGASARAFGIRATANAFGVSESHTNSLAHGKVYREGGRESSKNHAALAEKIEDRLDEVKDVALTKLMLSLGLLDEDKMDKATAKDLSGIAANLSKVVQNSSGNGNNKGTQVNLVVYAPESKVISDYQVVEVG
jgi:hypothetical protein